MISFKLPLDYRILGYYISNGRDAPRTGTAGTRRFGMNHKTTRKQYRWGQIFWSTPSTSHWLIRRWDGGFILRLGRFGLHLR